jgi:very-short-patch-repair endonuclease
MNATDRRALARGLADEQGGVLSRRQLRAVGITHDHVRNEVAAERWTTLGRQAVAVHGGPLPVRARAWAALWEVGEGIAVLDGVTSLAASGLTGFDEPVLHLSVRHTHDIPRLEGVYVHKVIRRLDDELVSVGIPRTRPAVAAVRAAGWAVSNRQAALVLLMPVQQRLTTPDALLLASRRCLGRRRRAFIRGVVRDIALGVESLGELDFARLCRARGLPEPSRQVLRRGPRGRMYLDVRWDRFDLVVEIDGMQHREGLAVSIDNLTRNAVVLGGDRVLRIDLVGLRCHEDEFLAQVGLGLATATRSR